MHQLLSDEERARLAVMSSIVRFKKGENYLREGDPPTQFSTSTRELSQHREASARKVDTKFDRDQTIVNAVSGAFDRLMLALAVHERSSSSMRGTFHFNTRVGLPGSCLSNDTAVADCSDCSSSRTCAAQALRGHGTGGFVLDLGAGAPRARRHSLC